jgi:carboxyl-terminal processing protease
MISRSLFCTLALTLPLAVMARKDPMFDRVRAAAKTLNAAQKAAEAKQFKESGEAWTKIATEFGDIRLLPDWAVRDAAFFAGEAFAQAGDADRAFACLEKALASWPWHNDLEKRETLTSLQKDPRWKGFLTRWNRAQSRDLTPTEKIYGLTRFWQEAKESFAYFDRVPELDWDAAYQEYLPKVLATKDRLEYTLTLQRFCALLKDGHTNIFTPNDLNPWGVLPLRFTEFGERIFVTDVLKSREKDFPIGSEVLEINGQPAAAYIRQENWPLIASSAEHIRWHASVLRLCVGKKNKQVRLLLQKPDHALVEKQFTYDAANFGGTMARLPASIPEFAQKDLGEGIILLTMGGFSSDTAAIEFEKALPILQKNCRGLVIDIRKNGGGNSGVGWRIARHLTDAPLQTSAWRTRERRAAYKAWGMFTRIESDWDSGSEERVRHFLGDAWYSEKGDMLAPAPETERLNVPVVVLTDYDTASAAEDFLIALDSAKHVTRVGRKTYGSTGQPIPLLLPGNIQARVCTKRDTFPDGRDFVGVGVIPHVEVESTPQDYFSQRDVILERGIAILKEKFSTFGQGARLASQISA